MRNEATPKSLLDGSVDRALVGMSAPIGLGMLSTFLFQIVDTYFVGRLGPDALAALSFAATTYFLGVALFMGLAVGVSALVGGALGREDRFGAQNYTTIALVSASVVGVGLAVLGVLTVDPVFLALGAPAELLPQIGDYISIIYGGMPFLVFGLVGSAAIRATGEVTPPEAILGLAGILNLVLDYLLIFGVGPFPELGIRGAAIATVASWVFVFSGIAFLLKLRQLVTRKLVDVRQRIVDIARLSSPAVATQVLLPVTATLTTFLAAESGPNLVAAFGVAQRVETLALVGVSSLSVAIVPFVAQNHGARRAERVARATAFAGRASMYWGGALLLVLWVFAEPIAAIFTEARAIIGFTKLYFYIVAASYAPYGILMLTAAIFNGIQLPGLSLRVLLVKTFALSAPLLVAGSHWGAPGIFGAIAAGNVLGCAYAARLMRTTLPPVDDALVPRALGAAKDPGLTP